MAERTAATEEMKNTEYVGTGMGWLIRIGSVSDQCHAV